MVGLVGVEGIRFSFSIHVNRRATLTCPGCQHGYDEQELLASSNNNFNAKARTANADATAVCNIRLFHAYPAASYMSLICFVCVCDVMRIIDCPYHTNSQNKYSITVI